MLLGKFLGAENGVVKADRATEANVAAQVRARMRACSNAPRMHVFGMRACTRVCACVSLRVSACVCACAVRHLRLRRLRLYGWHQGLQPRCSQGATYARAHARGLNAHAPCCVALPQAFDGRWLRSNDAGAVGVDGTEVTGEEHFSIMKVDPTTFAQGSC